MINADTESVVIATSDNYDFIFFHLVYETMFSVDSAGPATCKLESKWFGLTRSMSLQRFSPLRLETVVSTRKEMLKEYPASQREGEPRRRWFSDDYFDIIVWQDHNEAVLAFQLCYDKRRNEHSLTWTRSGGFRHDLIDDGESSPVKNKSPILIADGPFPASEVMARFRNSCEDIEQELRSFILEKLESCGEKWRQEA